MKGRSPASERHLIDTVLAWVATTTTQPLVIVAIPGEPPLLDVVAFTHDYYCTCHDAAAGLPCWHAVAIVQTLRNVTGGADARPT